MKTCNLRCDSQVDLSSQFHWNSDSTLIFLQINLSFSSFQGNSDRFTDHRRANPVRHRSSVVRKVDNDMRVFLFALQKVVNDKRVFLFLNKGNLHGIFRHFLSRVLLSRNLQPPTGRCVLMKTCCKAMSSSCTSVGVMKTRLPARPVGLLWMFRREAVDSVCRLFGRRPLCERY